MCRLIDEKGLKLNLGSLLSYLYDNNFVSTKLDKTLTEKYMFDTLIKRTNVPFGDCY